MLSLEVCDTGHLSDLTLAEDERLIIVSQTCDILCDSFELEPFLEVHIATRRTESDGSYLHGKHPRILDIEHTVHGDSFVYRIHDKRRRRIDRRVLIGRLPSEFLDANAVRVLANWTARRFTRPALPDEFNNRRKSREAKFVKIAKRYAADIASFYVTFKNDDGDDNELPAGTDDEIIITGAYLSEVTLNDERRLQARKAVDELAELLDGDGIAVVDSLAVSEDNISLSDVRHMVRLDLGYISARRGTFDDVIADA